MTWHSSWSILLKATTLGCGVACNHWLKVTILQDLLKKLTTTADLTYHAGQLQPPPQRLAVDRPQLLLQCLPCKVFSSPTHLALASYCKTPWKKLARGQESLFDLLWNWGGLAELLICPTKCFCKVQRLWQMTVGIHKETDGLKDYQFIHLHPTFNT